MERVRAADSGCCEVILGLCWDNGKEDGNYYSRVYFGFLIGIMGNRIETAI